jgi:hypothetical protein
MSDQIEPRKIEPRKIEQPRILKVAYVTLLMCGDSYLPGVMVVAHSLHKTKTLADIVCMVTLDVSAEARARLESMGVLVHPVSYLTYQSKPLKTERIRELYPWIAHSYTKWQALQLHYDKIILLDADMLIVKNIDHLFDMNTPAMLFNSAFAKPCGKLPNAFAQPCGLPNAYAPHGAKIPGGLVAQQLKTGPLVGMSSVMVLKPQPEHLTHFKEIMEHSQPFGFPACLNGYDEQSFAWFYSRIYPCEFFYNIYQNYANIQFKKNYVPADMPIYAYHYFSDQKPWQTDLAEQWPDFKLWIDTYAEIGI